MENINLDLSVTAEFSNKSDKDGKETHQTESLKNFDVTAKLELTEYQKNDLHEAFNLLDYNGEGKIKAEDFRVAIKALGYEPTKEELQKMINGVDKGLTGKLSFENFETAIMRKIMSLDSDGDIMKSFRLFDMDDCGFISFENLKQVTKILGIYLSDQEIEEMIDDADKDFDGFISVQEFMRMIKNSVDIVTP
ncbi:caltractin-like isoform X1 [Pieris napi]|uniref:caltractin-like isoform X1 n=1 Tax=Pieris napi TaxID=78633 RepID=UPI001FBBC051|nr:caltractin-like isoform X1 [Pieris napi]